MPQKDKDTLLIRLVRKDKLLIEQLHYRLLENEADLEHRVKNLKSLIQDSLDANFNKLDPPLNAQKYRLLNQTIRNLHGAIGLHEKTTRDKISDIECRILALKLLFELYPAYFKPTLLSTGWKFQKYITGRVNHVLMKYSRLHEDYQFDYYNDIEFIKNFVLQSECLDISLMPYWES